MILYHTIRVLRDINDKEYEILMSRYKMAGKVVRYFKYTNGTIVGV